MESPSFRCITYNPADAPRATLFFISSFKTKVWVYQLVIRKLVGFGFRVHAYDYTWKPLLDSYPHEWLKFSSHIKEDIKSKVYNEKNISTERRFGVIGVSVGAAIGLHAAKLIPEIERIMLVTTYGSIAQHIWEHPLLEDMRGKCQLAQMDYRFTRRVLGYFEPTERLDLIGGRKILLFVNRNDPVIPFSNTEVFITEAKKMRIHMIIKPIEAALHSLTILRVFKRPGLWISFLTALQHTHYPMHFDQDLQFHSSNRFKGRSHVVH